MRTLHESFEVVATLCGQFAKETESVATDGGAVPYVKTYYPDLIKELGMLLTNLGQCTLVD